MLKLFIVGFPGLYGGAGTELYHQIQLWRRGFPDIELNLIPTSNVYHNEPIYQEMLELGVKIQQPMDFSCIEHYDAVISFCSKVFLENLEKINERTKRVIWVNCMTYLFPLEKEKAHLNLIQQYLYQRPQIRCLHQKELESLGSTAQFTYFVPYFHQEGWEFSVKEQEFVNIGRISRQAPEKFSKHTLHIYEYITSPKFKRGHFLGFDHRSQMKTGKPFHWVKTYRDQRDCSVKDFYDRVDFIVQPTDTTENWPRIGFEAMFSGKPLVVDNRGGWQHMIRHGKTGFLCDTPQEFIYWGTRLAFEPELRREIADNALHDANELSSLYCSRHSWEKVFEIAFD